MTQLVFLYLGAGLTLIWGVAHLFPTKSVVEGFGEITALSMVIEEIAVGDKVNVRIYNNPVEHI